MLLDFMLRSAARCDSWSGCKAKFPWSWSNRSVPVCGPESWLGRRKIDPEPVGAAVNEAYASLVHRLAFLNTEADGPDLLRFRV